MAMVVVWPQRNEREKEEQEVLVIEGIKVKNDFSSNPEDNKLKASEKLQIYLATTALQRNTAPQIMNKNHLKPLSNVFQSNNVGRLSGTRHLFSMLELDTLHIFGQAKRREVKNDEFVKFGVFINDEDSVMAKSHVATSRLINVCARIFWRWDWTSNGNLCNKGSRIILGWNPDDVDIMVIAQMDQEIIVAEFNISYSIYTWKTMVFAWGLQFSSQFGRQIFGISIVDISMREFKECVEKLEVSDVNKSGLHFTWNQKPKGDHGVLKKIDRVMANLDFNDTFAGANALFQPYRIPNHSPAILRIPKHVKYRPKPLKFSNLLVLHENFKQVVMENWCMDMHGYEMYRVVKNLKHLKKPLRKLLFDKGNLHERVTRL
ncbi:RNA-directed DNA polymerase, eukaryota, Reverse transcriptase zinc-binding domain protein [Artemisia annua]|uniref:RNA-directed DNA polymerase, eukaryota, Reverse transcriptase zinc-binding domain protein n=1 Tax=Artemisia annua TaxID=35608 RepID=A0A2U1PHI3_ARTAN|nr:RNA-directed DNA polymerase, eukaryota, Reverse transcriptase zinc-binding domain protein [Artemisia annua]